MNAWQVGRKDRDVHVLAMRRLMAIAAVALCLAVPVAALVGNISPYSITIDGKIGGAANANDWVADATANVDTPSLINGVATGIDPTGASTGGIPTGAAGGAGHWRGLRIVDGVSKSGAPDRDTFVNGGKENDLSTWSIGPGNAGGGKSDISQCYVANNNEYLYCGMERIGNNGSTAFDFEFNQVAPSLSDPRNTASGAYVPTRTVGDVLLTFELISSSKSVVVHYYMYTAAGYTEFSITPGPTDPTLPPTPVALGMMNAGPVPAGPWGYVDSSGTWQLGMIPMLEFAEAKILLSTVFGPNYNPCTSKAYVQVRTRSAATRSSDLKDTTRIFSYAFGGPTAVADARSLDCSGTFTYDAAGSHVQDGQPLPDDPGLTYLWDITVPAGVTLSGGGVSGASTHYVSTSRTGTPAVTFPPGTTSAEIKCVLTVLETASGCRNQEPASATVTVTNTAIPVTITTPANPVCQNGPVVLAADLAGRVARSGAYRYLWSTGGVSPSISVATDAPGTTRYTVTVWDGQCTGTAAIDLVVNPAVSTYAGPDRSVCSGSPAIKLDGSITGGAVSGTWTTGGTGTFSSATDLTATYTPSAADIAAGSVTLTLTSIDPDGPCGAATDSMILTIWKAAVVEAGAAQTICSTTTSVTLAGSINGGATTGTWTTSGTGTFSSATDPHATYTPTIDDIVAGSVTLTLTSNDPEGPCGVVTDTMVITIMRAVSTYAGPDRSVCASSPTIALAGKIGGGATTGVWTTGGTGTFSSATDLHATYTPSASDIDAGSVTLTLTSSDPDGPCGADTDTMVLTINRAAVVSAGIDQTVCADTDIVPLSGSITGGVATGRWTGSMYGKFINATDPQTSYRPSEQDVARGYVTLTLTSDDPVGECGPIADTMVITFNPVVHVDAGQDQSVCSSSPVITLAGSITGGATTGIWTGGSGTFSSATDPHATYTPSAADVAAGSVTLTLTSIDPNGPCGAATDSMVLTIGKAAVVEAGADQTICSTTASVTLAGSINGGATTGTWTTSGSGEFTNASDPHATYTPSAADIAAGVVTLTLTSNDPDGPCDVVTDTMVLKINPNPAATIMTFSAACNALEITYEAEGSQDPNQSYSWNLISGPLGGPAYVVATMSGPAGTIAAGLAEGWYWTELTVTNLRTGCFGVGVAGPIWVSAPMAPSTPTKAADPDGTYVTLKGVYHSADAVQWEFRTSGSTSPVVAPGAWQAIGATTNTGSETTLTFTAAQFKQYGLKKSLTNVRINGVIYQGAQYDVDFRYTTKRTQPNGPCEAISGTVTASYIELADPSGHRVHKTK